MACRAIVIAALASGAGKTTMALSITRALALRGLRVQTFKVGPDFLDPTHLALASGRPCYNLDSWMCGKDYVRDLFARKTADADIAIIEGVMGLFDGASPDSIEGSTAEIAQLLDAPVLLTVHVRGMARTLAALVHGVCNFEPGVRLCGILANHCGSERHAEILRQALEGANLPPLAGSIPSGVFPELASRHLGLIAATKESLQTLDTYATVAEKHTQLEALLPEFVKSRGQGADGKGRKLENENPQRELVSENTPEPPRSRRERATCSPVAPQLRLDNPAPSSVLNNSEKNGNCSKSLLNPAPRPSFLSPLSSCAPRIAIAEDDAFSFYYRDTLEALEGAGAELVPFSPIKDTVLPRNIQAMYFGGGYPELHASALAANLCMLDAIRDFAQRGGFIYAECGGMMYLSQSIETTEGDVFAMTGLLPFGTRMTPKRKVLGYVEVTLEQDTLWGKKGQTCRGHEFHYSDIIPQETPSSGLSLAYTCQYRGTRAPRPGGYCGGNVLVDYIHLHWASNPLAVRHFIQTIGAPS